MKTITTKKDLKAFLKTDEAFTYGRGFLYKGFMVWWNNSDAVGIQTADSGYFRCDPCSKTEYKDYYALNSFCNYDWELS
jgi:hypothetical protein